MRMDPHASAVVVYDGAPIDNADLALIMVHGRNAAPKNILELIPRFDRPRVACVAPTAAGGSWYPNSFMQPTESNQPGLHSAMRMLDALVESLIAGGMPAHRIVLLGFSQGACLTAEFCIRYPRRYGGVVLFSGGFQGPDGTTWSDVNFDFVEMPVFLGCSDVDSHIPKERVMETSEVLIRCGAEVTQRLYAGMGHVVNDDEIMHLQDILDEAVTQ